MEEKVVECCHPALEIELLTSDFFFIRLNGVQGMPSIAIDCILFNNGRILLYSLIILECIVIFSQIILGLH